MLKQEYLLKIKQKRMGVICITSGSKSHPFLIGLHIPITVSPSIVNVVFGHFQIPFDAMGDVGIGKLEWTKKIIFVCNRIGQVGFVAAIHFLVPLLCLFEQDEHLIVAFGAAAVLRLCISNSCLFLSLTVAALMCLICCILDGDSKC